MDSPPQQLRIDANGLAFSALAWGEPDAPLVLCLHGYPDTAWTWRHLGPHLAARGRRVVAPFTRGYGPTDLAPDGDYTLGALAADAVALRDALGGGDDSALVGHDWGAITACLVAARRPDAFASFVSIAVPPACALKDAASLASLGPALAQLPRSWYIAFQQLPGASERALDRVLPRLWADWSPGYDADFDLVALFAALDAPARRTAALSYYRQNFGLRGLSTWFEVPRKPLLVLHGVDDGCVGLDVVRPAFDHLPTGSRAEAIDGGGHFCQLEQPAVVDELIATWVGAGDPAAVIASN